MKGARILLWFVGCVALFAPLIANDRPLIASVDGELRFPAFNSYLGGIDPGPGGTAWKTWWLDLETASADWAVMPPWNDGPREIQPVPFSSGPSWEHPLGVDGVGRDQFSRLIHGAGTAVKVAVSTVLIALLLGFVLGGLAGILGGVVDVLVSRTVEVFACFPMLIAVLTGAAFFGGSTMMLVCVLGGIYWTSVARIVRGELLSLREREFVHVARSLGIGHARVLIRHVLPAVSGPVLVCASFIAGSAIIAEATLSYFGLGDAIAVVSWGDMVRQGARHAVGGAWHLWVFPALAIGVVVVCLHALADRLDEELNEELEGNGRESPGRKLRRQ